MSAYPELYALVGGTVPDYRGLFLRGQGSQVHAQENGTTIGVTSTTHSSGALGTIQGDGIRNIVGTTVRADNSAAWLGSTTGAFSTFNKGNEGFGAVGTLPSSNYSGFSFDVSRVVPVASENRPVNTTVRYFIRALP
jgi:hypothetical protein